MKELYYLKIIIQKKIEEIIKQYVWRWVVQSISEMLKLKLD